RRLRGLHSALQESWRHFHQGIQEVDGRGNVTGSPNPKQTAIGLPQHIFRYWFIKEGVPIRCAIQEKILSLRGVGNHSCIHHSRQATAHSTHGRQVHHELDRTDGDQHHPHSDRVNTGRNSHAFPV